MRAGGGLSTRRRCGPGRPKGRCCARPALCKVDATSPAIEPMATASWTTERTAFDTRPSIPGSRRVGAAHARRQSQPDGRHSAPSAPPSRIGRSGGGLTGRRQRPRLNRRWCPPNSCSPKPVSRSTPAPARRPRLRHPPRGTRQEPTVRALRFSAPTAHAVGRPRTARRQRRATAPFRQAEGRRAPLRSWSGQRCGPAPAKGT